MVCTPRPVGAASAADAFAFSDAQGVIGRTVENVTLLWVAPWKAYWAFAFETLNPENYGLRG
ncbi:MAG: hypothetical protein ACFCUS_00440 [Rubrimonas sp.]|uniref:hypothetical protein n=1 Tax=Rubrimonas sp. TaxID=2036015 RepID=UPI002FDDB25D